MKMFDAIVVGSGAAGSWAAKELAEGGMNVALIEAGRLIDPKKDFPASGSMGTTLADRIFAGIGGQHVQARSALFYPQTRHFYVNDRQNPYTTPPGKPFTWLRGRQLGGRLHTWCRHALRVSDEEFQPPDDESNKDKRWPLSYADVAPYYAKVERTLGVYGRKDGIRNIPDGEFIPSPELSPLEQEFYRRVSEMPGLRITPARNVKHNQDRIPIPIALAQKTGRLSIEADAVVSHILVDPNDGQAVGVAVVNRVNKAKRKVFGRVVVLCASAFESVRILLNSACPSHPAGIGGESGVLGRYISDHVGYSFGGTLPPDLNELDHEEIVRTDDPYDFGYTHHYIPSFGRGAFGVQVALVQYAGDSGKQTRRSGFSLFGEMQPSRQNCITLSRSKVDAWGIPAVHIECAHAPDDLRMFENVKAVARELAEKVGLTDLVSASENQFGLLQPVMSRLYLTEHGLPYPGTTIHEGGGARMGEDPRSSVLNKFCQVWSCENVLVTDGACFPHVPFQNPTLTIMGLTVRACDHILKAGSL